MPRPNTRGDGPNKWRVDVGRLNQGEQVTVKAMLFDTATRGDGESAGYPLQEVILTITRDGVSASFPEITDAFGSDPEHAMPVLVEYDSGDPCVVVWADKEQEEPTHRINLCDARAQPLYAIRFTTDHADLPPESHAKVWWLTTAGLSQETACMSVDTSERQTFVSLAQARRALEQVKMAFWRHKGEIIDLTEGEE